MGIPTLIQEQNSFAGKTNRMLAAKAQSICVAYPRHGEGFFRQNAFTSVATPSVLPSQPWPINLAPQLCDLRLKPPWDWILTKLWCWFLAAAKGLAPSTKRLKPLNPCGWPPVIKSCGSAASFTMKISVSDCHSNQVVNSRPSLRTCLPPTAPADVIISRAGAGTLSELAAVAAPPPS